MAEINEQARERYFDELVIQFRKAGFTPQAVDGDGLLPVDWQGFPLCRATEDGGIRYRPEDITGQDVEAAKDLAVEITKTTAEYMKLIEQAQPLKATGLDGDYRLLSDFNDTVLTGHPTQYGVEFITWEWSYDRTGVGTGHYFDCGCKGYTAAKQDFATRTGLVPGNALFTPEQLTDLYRCICFARSEDSDLSYEADQRLDKLQGQIDLLVPDCRWRAKLSAKRRDRVSAIGVQKSLQGGRASCPPQKRATP